MCNCKKCLQKVQKVAIKRLKPGEKANIKKKN